MKKYNQQNIYKKVSIELENLLFSLKNSEDNNELDEHRQEAIQKLNGVKEIVVDNIKSLQKNSEWDNFTVAFYGETNAGKSTLIESLRILLNEDKKVEEHNIFNSLKISLEKLDIELSVKKQKLNVISEKFEASKKVILDEISKLKQDVKVGQHDFDVVILSINKKIIKYDREIEIIEEKIIDLKIKKYYLNQELLVKILSNMWYMIKSLFFKLEEQKEIKDLDDQFKYHMHKISHIKNNKEKLLEEINNEKFKFLAEFEIKNKQLEQLETRISQLSRENIEKSKELSLKVKEIELKIKKIVVKLEKISDGFIIGDGRSDFTQEVIDYHFKIKNKNFVVLDLPGIEGKEENLQQLIEEALEKSHVVFYVSKRPTPPQKGDDESIGTIEKISQQLSKHSEIHFIYNKPVRNPRQLHKALISDEDLKSLSVVDEELASVFGDNYVSHQYLTAYPAFLSVGNFVNEKFKKDRNNFLDKFSVKQKILEYSLILDFIEWMTGQLIIDIEKKMVRSNIKKISVTLDSTVSEIDMIYQVFNNLEDELCLNFKFTSSKLDKAGEIYNQNINNNVNRAVTDAKNKLRQKIYSDIEKGVSNKEFSSLLKNRIEAGILDFIDNLNSLIGKSGQEFENDISNIVKTYQKYVEELVNKYSKSVHFDFNFNPKVKIKANIDIGATVTELVSGIIGIIFTIINASNPIGWVLLGVSVLTFIFSTYKKIHALLDQDFYKSQQRKSADENINKAFDEINLELTKPLSNIKKEIQNGIEEIMNELRKPIIHIETMSEIFLHTKNNVKKISKNVIGEGEDYSEHSGTI